MNITPQEQRTLAEALSMAADGINEVRKVLTLIGNRLGAEFSESSLYIGSIAAFYADQQPPLGFMGRSFSADKFWKQKPS